MRLDKFLSDETSYSRKELKAVIRSGRVSVNGAVCKIPDQNVVPETDKISLDGKALSQTGLLIVMMNKPQGYVTATEDSTDKTVMELLPPELRGKGLLPIGRLDKDTEGLLLFTNDGELLHRMISPKKGIIKCYYAEHEGTADEADIEAFQNGILLRDGTECLPAKLEVLGEGRSLITVVEGKYHQVRRMMAARKLHVNYLKRLTEGALSLGNLSPGKCRLLSVEETASVLTAVGMQ